ncbi:MAG TPA: hypothetical protein VH139_04450 [Acidobacteriaceae bacterium]|jgi:hypothetical protein|nr:hypothetical protein [Acidobacteriaceae bacterium]
MKLVSFHLMAYRPLDLEEAAKHRSPWVVLPNRLYDPVKGAEEYARHIDALVYADELGFDAIGVNEHHHGYLTLYILVSPDRKGHSDDGQKLIAALNFRNAEQFAEACASMSRSTATRMASENTAYPAQWPRADLPEGASSADRARALSAVTMRVPLREPLSAPETPPDIWHRGTRFQSGGSAQTGAPAPP